MGTVAYMSPEQALGQDDLDARTDLFSLGVVLYEMATGVQPFRGGSAMIVLNDVINKIPSPPEEVNPDIAPELAAVIKRCLEKDPDLRYQSAGELLGDLKALRSGAGSGHRSLWASHRRTTIPSGPASRFGSNRSLWLAAGLVALFVSAALWLAVSRTAGGDVAGGVSEVEEVDRSIAVLPFANLSTFEENAFFAEGVHEDILNRLAGVRDLKVISKNSVRRLADDEAGLREVARYVVEGSVRRSENQVRVTARLADSHTDKVLWAQSFDEQLVDVFAVQSAIAEQIANLLEAEISPAERSHLKAVPTVVVEAYDEYLKARPMLSSLWLSLGRIDDALAHLENALEADPDFAAGWALMARGQAARYQKLGEVGDRESEQQQARDAAMSALETARRLDPNGVATLRAAGYFYNAVEKDTANALRSLDQALDIVPDDAETLFFQAWIYTELGQVAEAITALEKSLALDPANGLTAYGLSFALEMDGRFEALVDFYEKRLLLYPERTHYRIDARYYQFLAEGSLAAFHAFEHAVKTVERTEECDLRSIKNAEMVVAMVNEEFESYREAWTGKWEEHHAGHGNWSCPGQINDEINHAVLEIEYGDPEAAERVLEIARASTVRPYSQAVCIFDRATFEPKLLYLQGEKERARRQLEDTIPKIMLNDTFPRVAIERGVLLEAVDLVSPDRVYSVYRQILDQGISTVSFESVCANPWSYPNLLRDPQFVADVRRDGRFVEFLEHYGLIPEAA